MVIMTNTDRYQYYPGGSVTRIEPVKIIQDNKPEPRGFNKNKNMKKYVRPGKADYYLDIARTVSKRSTCLRRRYGAVIVNKFDEIIATGYNGSPRGEKNCCDIGECYREAHNIPHGSNYELCKSVHAEANAIISASRRDMIDSTLYLAGFEGDKEIENPVPCLMCERLIKNAGISRIITLVNKDKKFLWDLI